MPLFNNFRQNSRLGTGMGSYRDAKPGMPGIQPIDAKPGMPGFQPILQNPRTGMGMLPQNMNPTMQQHASIYQQPMQDPRLGIGMMNPEDDILSPVDIPLGPGKNIPAINRKGLFFR